MTIWRMRIAYWTPKSTNTIRKRNTYCFSTARIVAWPRLIVTLHVHCLLYLEWRRPVLCCKERTEMFVPQIVNLIYVYNRTESVVRRSSDLQLSFFRKSTLGNKTENVEHEVLNCIFCSLLSLFMSVHFKQNITLKTVKKRTKFIFQCHHIAWGKISSTYSTCTLSNYTTN
jgi:hypothetical protein